MRKPLLDKTWINFIDYFRQAHQEIRDTDTSMYKLGYQSANPIDKQIVERLRYEEEIIILPPPPVYELPPMYALPGQPPPPPVYAPPAQPPPPPQANAVVPADPNAAVLQAMIQNMKLMHDNVHQKFYQGQGRGRSRGLGRGRGRGGGRGRGEQNMGGGSYFHTHGHCAYLEIKCRTLGPNNNNDATFANMREGRKLRCYWINP